MTNIDRTHADETRVYDLANRVTSIANTNAVGTLSYAWDNNSNKLSETWTGNMSGWSFTTQKPGAGSFEDGYDAEDRFRRFIRSGQSTDVYLDRSAIGNITDVATNGTSALRTLGSAHELTSVGGNSQTFDNRGNTTGTHSGLSLSYDLDRRLAQAIPVAGTTIEFQYDALGKRIGRKVTENSVVTEDSVYVHAGPNCIAEYTRGTAATSPMREYVYGDEIDSLVMLVDSGGTRKLAVTRNQQWSVTALVNEANGKIVERYSYDQFGKRTVHDADGFVVSGGTQYGNPYGYTSRRHDATSGLMHFRARDYDPSTGEFLTRDPLGYVDGWSLYRGYMGLEAVDADGRDVYVIDGTGAKYGDGTACQKMFDEAKDQGRYFDGTGSQSSCLGINWAFNGATGFSNFATISALKEIICKDVCNNRGLQIDLLGWSRGAVGVIEVAQRLNDDGCCCKWKRSGFLNLGWSCVDEIKPVRVNWIGLFDPVNMHIGSGNDPRIPNVRKVSIARRTAQDGIFNSSERQALGDLSSGWPTIFPQYPDIPGAIEKDIYNFCGSRSLHGEVGGASTGDRNSSIAWMTEEAMNNNVEFK